MIKRADNALPSFLVLAFLLCDCASAHASLKWKETQQTFRPESQQKAINAHFEFENQGPGSVTLTNIETSCGCTVALSSKPIYAPGEKGAITVTYTIGDQTGLQVRTIAVSTDDPQHPLYALTLTVNLPEPLKIVPKYVYWPVGSTATSQAITLTADPSHSVRILSVASNVPKLDATLSVQQDGKAYSILVKPADTKDPSRAMLTIETDLQLNGKNRKFFAYAEVRPAATSSSSP